MFIEWAVRNGLSEVGKGRLDKQIKNKGRFIFIKQPKEIEENDSNAREYEEIL